MFIGVDPEKTVVSPYPIKLSSGRALRFRYGVITEIVPRPPSGLSRADLVRSGSQLSLVLVIVSAVLSALGVPWWAAASGSALLVAFVTILRGRAARPARLVAPPGDDVFVLLAPRERAAYARALSVARRVRRTWPALRHMIDPAEADRTLAAALRDLAAVLTKRQQLRRLRMELRGDAGLPADSPAVRALQEQRDRVEELWLTTRAEADRILMALYATARAGEEFVREQRLHETVRNAELALSRLTAGAPSAAPELAERTAAVVAAYRELATD